MTRPGQAFELLRTANPIPPPRRTGNRRRLTLTLAFAVILVGALLVAPAIGIRVPPLNFWTAEKAPPNVVHDFETLSEGAPPGMDPGAIPGESRKVRLADGQTLWVAPTRHGGFCTLGAGGGGCDKLGTVPLGVGWQAGRISIEDATRPGGPPASAFISVSGFVNAMYADAVEVRFADGEVERLDPAWVSDPIGAGFFHYTIPTEHRRPGHEIESVVALDRDGRVVTESRRARGKAPPVDALVDEKRVALRLGGVVIWKAPTRYEGTCTWLEHRGTRKPVRPCLPRGYDKQPVLSLSLLPVEGSTVLVGACGYAAVQLTRPEGSVRNVKCVDGLVLTELRRDELAGHLGALDERSRPLPGSQIPLSRLQPTDSAR